jgi:hypothetical protein
MKFNKHKINNNLDDIPLDAPRDRKLHKYLDPLEFFTPCSLAHKPLSMKIAAQMVCVEKI